MREKSRKYPVFTEVWVSETARLTAKPEKNAYYDVTVVCSPTEDGRAHRSASVAADTYWVEKADVARRCKQAGMHWRHHNAVRISAILATLRSGTFVP